MRCGKSFDENIGENTESDSGNSPSQKDRAFRAAFNGVLQSAVRRALRAIEPEKDSLPERSQDHLRMLQFELRDRGVETPKYFLPRRR